jgi:DNA-binding beta-propeller fold protein YncE
MVHVVVSPATIGRRRSRSLLSFTALAIAVVGSALYVRAQSAPAASTQVPGALSDGTTLLPNGWRLAPAGRHVKVGTLPLNIVTSPDGKYGVITNNGVNRPTLSVVDIATWTVKTTATVDAAWLGLVFSPDGTKLYSSGAGQNNVQEFAFADGAITRARTFALPTVAAESFAGGLAISRDGRTLYATRLFAMTLSSIDLTTGVVTRTVPLQAEPYTALVSADGRFVFVSLWGGSVVEVYAADSLMLVTEMYTAEHPNAMALSPDGKRLFVACGNSASVWVFDTFSNLAIEQISTSLYPEQPPTSTPNSVAVSPDGRTLLVANADTNSVASVDVSNPARAFVDGFIPTGWYPTGAAFTRDGRQIMMLSGKGFAGAANPLTGGMETRLLGVASILPVPDRTTLNDFTRKVYSLTPYTDATRVRPAGVPVGSPVPQTVGGSSPIKHVFYVIRENRTYDQVLGDLTEGNGDQRLALFGREVTPNAHALAQAFVVFDNFYVDADVSYNGHAYSTAAYATDFIEKLWQANLMSRGVQYLGEGGGFMRNPFGNITAPMMGYLWDYARRAGLTVRSYGEFVAHTRAADGAISAVESVPGLQGAVAPAYAGWDLDVTDGKRLDAWLLEFRQFEANGNLPQLSIIRLPNDHTAGTRAGAPTPRAMMADNDLALGRLVETISNSAYWRDSAIFVVEDDAQSGPDHVDSHRSILLMASPFARRSAADHTFYTTSGVLRTIELVLGLPPMSQYDAAATPMYNAFVGAPNLAPFRHVDPRVPLDERNSPTAYGSIQSMMMDFSQEDRAPEALLNEILWRSIRGANAPMPPPRRSVFVTPASRTAIDLDDDER